MNVFYEDDAVTIIHGDCRELLPALAGFDVVVTDPPYGIDGGRGGDANEFGKGRYAAFGWSDTPDYIRGEVAPLIAVLVQAGHPMAVTPGNRNLWAYPQPRDVGCFWTPASSTHGPWGFACFHPILYYGSDWRAGKGALPSGRMVTEAAEKLDHPCPKPLGAWRWLVDKVAAPGTVILDPFAGTGTTLRAAKDLGRRAIGVEIEERYCEIAAQRCAQEVLEFA